MPRISASDKVEAAFKVLCEKGPLSISSLSEEVARLLHGKTSTIRSAMVQLLKELEELGFVREVGTDQYGSKLMDLTPAAFSVLISMISAYGGFKLIKKETMRKALEKRAPHLLPYFDLFIVLSDYRNKKYGLDKGTKEELDFLEELRVALEFESKLRGEFPKDWNELKDSLIGAIGGVIRDLVESSELEDALKEVSKNPAFRQPLTEGFNEALTEIKEEIEKLQDELRKLKELKRKIPSN